jgi:hypothetical protein
MTPSEQLVFDLCRRSALSLWAYANPRRNDGRELCDVLLVFGEDVVIFSVKEIALNEAADPEVAAERWTRKAIDESVPQLIGAHRELTRMRQVVRHDGAAGIELPAVEKRRVYLVAVAAGGKRRVPFAGGGRDGGRYVHVMEAEALREILGELDTTPDFLEYLKAKEDFQGSIVCEGEENLFAVYLHAGRKMPTGLHMVIAQDDLWSELRSKPEFQRRKEEDKVSYWWDEMLERFIGDYDVSAEAGTSPTQHETAVRVLAAENRFARRILSGACVNWLQGREAGTRNLKSPTSGVGYVFGTFPRNWDRKYRQTELEARCFVARSPSVLNCETVIGIATEVYDAAGYSMDSVYLHMPRWTEQDEEVAQETRRRFGILQEPRFSSGSFHEFPAAVPSRTPRADKNRRKRERRARR